MDFLSTLFFASLREDTSVNSSLNMSRTVRQAGLFKIIIMIIINLIDKALFEAPRMLILNLLIIHATVPQWWWQATCVCVGKLSYTGKYVKSCTHLVKIDTIAL